MSTREPAVVTLDPEQLQLEAEIALARQRVASSTTALQRQLAQATDWRAWVRREPTVALLLAFGVGVVIGRRKK